MSKFVDKIAGALGFTTNEAEENETNDYDDYDDYQDEDTYESTPGVSNFSSYSRASSRYDNSDSRYTRDQSSSYRTASYRTSGYQSAGTTTDRNGSKVLNLHASVQMQVVVASPESFDEARVIAQNIKDNKPVIINLEFVEHSIAQRITDFLCGCCCAVDGNIQRIADKIFMIAPGNVDFAGDVDIRQSLETEGLAFPWGQRQ